MKEPKGPVRRVEYDGQAVEYGETMPAAFRRALAIAAGATCGVLIVLAGLTLATMAYGWLLERWT